MALNIGEFLNMKNNQDDIAFHKSSEKNDSTFEKKNKFTKKKKSETKGCKEVIHKLLKKLGYY